MIGLLVLVIKAPLLVKIRGGVFLHTHTIKNINMHKFKPNDEIRCIIDDDDYLKRGNTYIVLHEDENCHIGHFLCGIERFARLFFIKLFLNIVYKYVSHTIYFICLLNWFCKGYVFNHYHYHLHTI